MSVPSGHVDMLVEKAVPHGLEKSGDQAVWTRAEYLSFPVNIGQIEVSHNQSVWGIGLSHFCSQVEESVVLLVSCIWAAIDAPHYNLSSVYSSSLQFTASYSSSVQFTASSSSVSPLVVRCFVL